MKKISRRDFVKGTIGMAAAGVLGACQSPAEGMSAAAASPTQTEALQETCRREGGAGEKLRIEIPRHPSTLLDDVLKCFSALYPDREVDIIRSNSEGRIPRLLAGKIDVAEMPYCEELKREGLNYIHLVNNRYMCLMSPVHPLAVQEEIDPKELVSYPVFVAIKKKRRELLQYLRDCAGIYVQEASGEELDGLLNACYNNGIFITPAYYAARLEVVTAVPLRAGITKEIGLACLENPGPYVRDFIGLAKEIYPD